MGRGRGGTASPYFFGLKFVQKLVHCCNWLLTEKQCKIKKHRSATDTRTRVAVSQDKTKDPLWQFF